MTNTNVHWIGMKELQNAIKRNPKKVVDETKLFITRGLRAYKTGINRSPWRMGQNGGGAPVSTGNLRDRHATVVSDFEGAIYPTAKYAPYVHGIAGWPRKRSYQLRPWLDFVRQDKKMEIETLYHKLLQNIAGDLAK